MLADNDKNTTLATIPLDFDTTMGQVLDWVTGANLWIACTYDICGWMIKCAQSYGTLSVNLVDTDGTHTTKKAYYDAGLAQVKSIEKAVIFMANNNGNADPKIAALFNTMCHQQNLNRMRLSSYAAT